jgi:hypothetical protein
MPGKYGESKEKPFKIKDQLALDVLAASIYLEL